MVLCDCDDADFGRASCGAGGITKTVPGMGNPC